jgi:hypothetical protein
MISHIIDLIKQDKFGHKSHDFNIVLIFCDKQHELSLYKNRVIDIQEMTGNIYMLFWHFMVMLNKLRFAVQYHSNILRMDFKTKHGKINAQISVNNFEIY